MRQKKKIHPSTVSGCAAALSLVFAIGSVGALSDFNISILQGIVQIGISMMSTLFFGIMAMVLEKLEKGERNGSEYKGRDRCDMYWHDGKFGR